MRGSLATLAASALLLGAAGAAQAHEPPLGPAVAAAPAAPGSGEAALRRLETQSLGAEHAAVHARQRELAARAARAGASAGPETAPPAASALGPPAQVGKWDAPDPLPVIAINSIMLPTGKVLIFAYPGRPGEPDSEYRNVANAYLWDPVTKLSKRVDPPDDPTTTEVGGTNIWCGAASLLADGRVLVTGGNVDSPTADFHGIRTVFTFDPFTETWARHQEMRQGRWYPSQLLMPDGRTLIAGGFTRPGDPDDVGGGPSTNRDLEFFSPDGTISRDGLRFNENGPPIYPLYPKLFWMPSGRALAAGPMRSDSWFLNPAARGATSTWNDADDLNVGREWGTAVLLSGGRVMTFGGSEREEEDGPGNDGRRPPQSSTEIFDEDEPGLGWRPAKPMAVGRSHANSVLLPDGTVATIGGGFGEDLSNHYYRWLYSASQRQVELYDPSDGSVIVGAAQAEGRTYHSTALLLPDGRVMSAGDDINGTPTAANPTGAGLGINDDTAEIYSPPYLFDANGDPAPRPALTSAPVAVRPGDPFEVDVTGTPATGAVIIAPGSSTHDTDMSQRRVQLAGPEPGPGGRMVLRMPANVNVAPPGPYMVFLLSADGVPSVARFVRIDPNAPPYVPTAVTAPPPAPAPAPEPAPAPPPPPASEPKVNVTGRLPSRRELLDKDRFSVMVGVSAPATVKLSALLERGKSPAIAVATRRTTTFKAGGRRRVTFKLTRTGHRLLAVRRRFVVRIRTTATFGSRRVVVVQTRRRVQ